MAIIGTLIEGKYEILKLIGKGGMSEVYLAMDKNLNKQWAVKEIKKRARDKNNEVVVQSAIAEANMMKKLDHPCLPRIVDIIDKEDVIYVVMDYIEGEPLNKVLERDGAQPQETVIEWAEELCGVLDYLHMQNPPIIYRDMKPANIMLQPNGNIKLIDFGIAREYKEHNLEDTVSLGTKGYAAPEVRGTEERYDYTADIYSFGIMLYVLANHLKFPDSNTYSANPRIQYMSGYVLPEPEGDISKELYDIIARACRYNPDDRYQSIEEMLLDIETLIYGENFGFKKEYKRVYMVVGLIMLALGMGAWKLTLVPEMTIRISFLQYIFLAGCLGKGIFKILKKDTTFISVVIFAVGVYLMASSGFSWLKLFFLLWMTSSSGLHSGVVASGILIANFTSLLQSLNGMNLWIYSGYGWIAITLISIAYILLTQYIWLV